MYVPKHFAATDRAALVDLIERNGFAILITVEDGVPVATHLPLLLDHDAAGNDMLLGHVARRNPQWKGFDTGAQAMAVFWGPHAYISPTWYRNPERSVPTWNYTAVHAYGTPRVIEDADRSRDVVARLVAQYEGEGAGTWSMDVLPEDYVRNNMNGIVAFEMPIDRLEGKFKLNQNKSAEDRKGVIAALKATGAPLDMDVADLMEEGGE